MTVSQILRNGIQNHGNLFPHALKPVTWRLHIWFGVNLYCGEWDTLFLILKSRMRSCPQFKYMCASLGQCALLGSVEKTKKWSNDSNRSKDTCEIIRSYVKIVIVYLWIAVDIWYTHRVHPPTTKEVLQWSIWNDRIQLRCSWVISLRERQLQDTPCKPPNLGIDVEHFVRLLVDWLLMLLQQLQMQVLTIYALSKCWRKMVMRFEARRRSDGPC